jgi:predicted ATPase
VLHFTEVSFDNFKAFSKFRLSLKEFNILVGPNNAGKSTIIAAFRILAAGIRKARAKRGEMIRGPNGPTMAYAVDMETLSVSGENVFSIMMIASPRWFSFLYPIGSR